MQCLIPHLTVWPDPHLYSYTSEKEEKKSPVYHNLCSSVPETKTSHPYLNLHHNRCEILNFICLLFGSEQAMYALRVVNQKKIKVVDQTADQLAESD